MRSSPSFLQFSARYILLCCRVCTIALLAAIAAATPAGLIAQSTFGSILGSVSDSSGSVVAGAAVTLSNVNTGATRTAATNASGTYTFSNVDAGKYTVRIAMKGFEAAYFPNVQLLSREAVRVDATLVVGSVSDTISVQASQEAVINTEQSSVSSVEDSAQLQNLPLAIYAHSQGSTSPLTTITTQPQVQVDDSGNFSVAGTKPALMSYTLDGISSINVEFSGPLSEMFPSFGSIAEMRISAVNNNAEYSGVADVTTTSRAGSNRIHGSVFENHENTALNAGDPFTGLTPKIIMNNFGGAVGGPVVVPHLFNGHDKLFFFASYEGLRLPLETPMTTTTPTKEMRAGNVCAYLGIVGVSNIYNYDGTELDCSAVPVNSTSAAIIQRLYPLPNVGNASTYPNNYAVNFPSPVESNQGDLRLDWNINSRQSAFARFNYKNRQVTVAPSPDCLGYCATSSSPMLGAFQMPQIDSGLTVAHNFIFSPRLMNEFRSGYTIMHTSTDQNVDTAKLLSETQITGLPDINTTAVSTPNIVVSGLLNTGGNGTAVKRGRIYQFLDNLSWMPNRHTFKFGADYKLIFDHDDNVFSNYRSGDFYFNGSSSVGAGIGDPYTQFLLGYPDSSQLGEVNDPNMDGRGSSWAFYAQDDWKITPRLTINAGLRWEVHPPMREAHGNSATFQTDYTSSTVNGAVVVPNTAALNWTNTDFAKSIAPTPILTSQQAHIPRELRVTDKADWGPRVGFAWRIDGSGKTVLRGGWGRFIEVPLGYQLNCGWAVSASYIPTFDQDYDTNGKPILAFPSAFPADISQTGSSNFYEAYPITYRDPNVQQWNLTFERDLGRATGVRLSYTGSHGSNLETFVDLNQVKPNTAGYASVASKRPYPAWQVVQSVENMGESNYNAATVDVSKRLSNGLQFESSYVWTRDLSNEGGAVPSGFVSAGGNYVSNRFQPGLDYGRVSFDRAHRFLTTFLYNLPFGREQKFLADGNALLNGLVAGWQMSGVVVIQSGAFLTPYEESTDPAGTNVESVVGYTRADRVRGVSMYARKGTNVGSDPLWLNSAAFSIPDDNIGRFGNAAVGSVVGPGTKNVALGMLKSIKLLQGVELDLGIQASNLLNRRNYDVPNMQLDSGAFGQISALQSAEGTGPRTAQITGRITF